MWYCKHVTLIYPFHATIHTFFLLYDARVAVVQCAEAQGLSSLLSLSLSGWFGEESDGSVGGGWRSAGPIGRGGRKRAASRSQRRERRGDSAWYEAIPYIFFFCCYLHEAFPYLFFLPSSAAVCLCLPASALSFFSFRKERNRRTSRVVHLHARSRSRMVDRHSRRKRQHPTPHILKWIPNIQVVHSLSTT